MELFRIDEFVKMENPNPGERYRQDILTDKEKAAHLFGIFIVLTPGENVPYHYHAERESLICAISGEATETVEGRDFQFKAGDVLYIPAGEKHGMANNTNEEFRFLEYYTGSPGVDDRIMVNNS